MLDVTERKWTRERVYTLHMRQAKRKYIKKPYVESRFGMGEVMTARDRRKERPQGKVKEWTSEKESEQSRPQNTTFVLIN